MSTKDTSGSTPQHSHPHNNTMSRNEKFWVDQVTVPQPPPGNDKGWGTTRGGGGTYFCTCIMIHNIRASNFPLHPCIPWDMLGLKCNSCVLGPLPYCMELADYTLTSSVATHCPPSPSPAGGRACADG